MNEDDRWHTKADLWEKLKNKARDMRIAPTEAEKLLWLYLRDGKLKSYKFRRQHNLGQFIVDFYCKKAKLIIEVDGPIHEFQKEADSARQEYLENHEFRVLRFSNDIVVNNIGKVVGQITSYLNSK